MLLFIILFIVLNLTITAQVTYINTLLEGKMNINDVPNSGATYGPSALLISKPAGSIATLNLNIDGTYYFIANGVGCYIYEVPICFLPTGSDCITAKLKFCVVDFLEPELRPIANSDFGMTKINTAVTLKSLENDRCIVTNGCELDATSVSIVSQPSQGGSASVDASNGDITYTPAQDFVGKDTLTYQVCVDGDALNCIVAEQIITILAGTTSNFTFAVDDFASTQQSTPVSGNVLNNDMDVEGDILSAVAQDITLSEGTFTLFSTGDYVFEPAEYFFGPVNILYSICDDNMSVACADATLHILVVRDLTIRVRVYLEGPLLNNDNEVGTTHERPLMRDNLRISPYTSKRYIPDNDPYAPMSAISWEGGKEKYAHIESGLISKFTFIADPLSVFDVSGEDAITDWIFVELRSKFDYTNIISTRSGLVQRDGDIVDLDGVSGLRFSGIDVDDYYVVVRHRNHLGAMTASAKTPSQLDELVDFTKVETGFFDFGNTKYDGLFDYTNLAQSSHTIMGYLALYGGDFDGNGKIKYSSPNDDLSILFEEVMGHERLDDNGNVIGYNYFTSFNLAYGYHRGDYNMDSKVRFTNPIDDMNMVYGQLIFYPLNTTYSSLFNHFIEQIPE